MKKINLAAILLLSFMCITFVQAVEIEPGTQGEEIELYQTCNNCTYCNFTRIAGPDNNTILSNVETTKDGTYYYYLLDGSNTERLGWYRYSYDCGNAVDSTTGKINFEITPQGRNGNDNIVLFIILIVMIYAIAFVSFFGRNIPLSILTGMLLSFLGVWIIRNGMIIYRDNLTNYFGYVTIGVGAIMSIMAILGWIEDTF